MNALAPIAVRVTIAWLTALLCLTGAASCGWSSTSGPDTGQGASGGATGGRATGGAGSGGSAGAFASGGLGGVGASGASGGGAAGSVGIPPDSLAHKYADYFPIGAAVSAWHLDNLSAIVENDFNHLTCENAMKMRNVHPAEATFNWTEADRIADFARERGMKLTGHTLLWHRQSPAWMFQGITADAGVSLETLKARLKAHIDAVIGRYADVVDNWDVVNEAISDDPTKTYRDGSEMSRWYEVFGSEEYIYWAYQYAHDALEFNSPGSSQGKLYYNEYVVTVKADKILSMLAWLKNEKGIQVDGVGFQSHENLTWPTTTDLQAAFDKFAAAGYKVKISELDVTVYDDYATGAFVPEPQATFSAGLEATQAARSAGLFELYRKNKSLITSVTFWGVSDDNTWLDNVVAGRNDFPLIYDDLHMPKAARRAIMTF
jgi:endo-1,4-beta-xylanase